jgi:hypothetical protein
MEWFQQKWFYIYQFYLSKRHFMFKNVPKSIKKLRLKTQLMTKINNVTHNLYQIIFSDMNVNLNRELHNNIMCSDSLSICTPTYSA